MKKWAWIVAGLYGLVFFLLMVPLIWIAFWPKVRDVAKLGSELVCWQMGALVLVMIAAQFALLRIPVYVAGRKALTRRPLWATITAAALMMALLTAGAVGSVYEAVTQMKVGNPFFIALAVALISWIFWGVYFQRSTRLRAPADRVKHLQRFLWSGSILELLVAIPTHIIARNREYCCAGLWTFFGLTCGFSVMLFAFGPAVYFLFAARWQQLHPRPEST